MTAVDLTDPTEWAEWAGATVDSEGLAHLYKAVDSNFVAGHGYIPTTYTVGEDVTAGDFRPTNGCGYGLHVSPHPHQALSHHPTAKHVLEVTVRVTDLFPIVDWSSPAKAKAQTVHVLREVTTTGAPITAEAKA